MYKKVKKIIVLSLVVFMFGFAANGQKFKTYKVGLGVGYASPEGKGGKDGYLFYLEPAYRVSDILLVGLRLESAFTSRGYTGDFDLGTDNLDVAVIGSYTLNGQYYFSNSTFRPFVGAGLGLYSLVGLKIEFDESSTVHSSKLPVTNQFGFYPRLGFDLDHFNFSMDYNIIPVSKVKGGEIRNSYLSFRIGFSIGGGRL